jgi:pimeloyl-ACP methyl ester carboxylesterase
MSSLPARCRALNPFGPSWRGRPISRLALIVCELYAVVVLAMYLAQDLFVFPGAAFANYWREPYAELRAEDVWLRSPAGRDIHAWWCAPPGWSPGDGAILYSHGNGSNLSKRQGAIVRWRRATGRAVLAYDYPGFGKSPGWPSEEGCYDASEAALGWLREKGVPSMEVLHVGESLGSGVAVEMARRHGARMLVLLCPYTSIPDMAAEQFPWLPGRWLVRARFASLEKAPAVDGPVLIAHGTEDRVVPIRYGERLFAAFPGPKRLFTLAGEGHVHPSSTDFFDAVRRLLAETEGCVNPRR